MNAVIPSTISSGGQPTSRWIIRRLSTTTAQRTASICGAMSAPRSSGRRSCTIGRCSRSCSRQRDKRRRVTGGKRMTTHDHQTLTDSHDDPSPRSGKPPQAGDDRQPRRSNRRRPRVRRHRPSTMQSNQTPGRIGGSLRPPLAQRTNHQRSSCFSPITTSRTCARGGPVCRPPSSTTRRIACRRPMSWSPIWSTGSRTDSPHARSRLEEQWARGEQASTEDLRLALMHYRDFFERLLAVSAAAAHTRAGGDPPRHGVSRERRG